MARRHRVTKIGILVAALGGLLDLFVPGPWTQVGAIVGGAVGAIGVERKVNDVIDRKKRGD